MPLHEMTGGSADGDELDINPLYTRVLHRPVPRDTAARSRACCRTRRCRWCGTS